MKEGEVTQLGLLHQGQTEAERSGRDPAVGSPPRTPTPSPYKARQGLRILSQGWGAGLCSQRRRRRKARTWTSPRRLALQSLSPRGGSWREGHKGLWYPAVRLRLARAPEHPCAASAAHTRAHPGAQTPAHKPLAPGARLPARLLSPAAAPDPRLPTWPCGHTQSPPGRPCAPPSSSAGHWSGGASRAFRPQKVIAGKGKASYRVL